MSLISPPYLNVFLLCGFLMWLEPAWWVEYSNLVQSRLEEIQSQLGE